MPSPTTSRKLTISMAPKTAELLENLAHRKGITVTEYLRRAAATQSVIDALSAEYGELEIVVPETKASVHRLTAML